MYEGPTPHNEWRTSCDGAARWLPRNLSAALGAAALAARARWRELHAIVWWRRAHGHLKPAKPAREFVLGPFPHLNNCPAFEELASEDVYVPAEIARKVEVAVLDHCYSVAP